ncbi:carboxypeptidase-like regulatory domain-containing protein, partial [Spirosoma sp. 48-14]
MNHYSIPLSRYLFGFMLLIGLLTSQTVVLANLRKTFLLHQVIRISGTVTDEQNQPIPGVNIVEKQTRKGTVTDANGQFSLDVNAGATLVFSSVGFATQEVIVGSQPILTVRLKEDVNQLSEVVAVGYQTLRKSDVTGAISNVKARELNVAAPTLGQALVGKLAGVQVSQV